MVEDCVTAFFNKWNYPFIIFKQKKKLIKFLLFLKLILYRQAWLRDVSMECVFSKVSYNVSSYTLYYDPNGIGKCELEQRIHNLSLRYSVIAFSSVPSS